MEVEESKLAERRHRPAVGCVVVVTGNSRDQTRPRGGSGQDEVLRELRGQGVRRVSERPEKTDYVIHRKHVLAN